MGVKVTAIGGSLALLVVRLLEVVVKIGLVEEGGMPVLTLVVGGVRAGIGMVMGVVAGGVALLVALSEEVGVGGDHF